MRIPVFRWRFARVVVLGLLAGCSTIAPFNQKGYEQATSLKVDALATMDKATEPFTSQQQNIAALKLNVEKAYEYAKGRPQNEETIQQWAILKDPSRNSLGGFLRRWEEKSVLQRNFIEQAKDLVSDGFDTVIALESGKRQPDHLQQQ